MFNNYGGRKKKFKSLIFHFSVSQQSLINPSRSFGFRTLNKLVYTLFFNSNLLDRSNFKVFAIIRINTINSSDPSKYLYKSKVGNEGGMLKPG